MVAASSAAAAADETATTAVDFGFIAATTAATGAARARAALAVAQEAQVMQNQAVQGRSCVGTLLDGLGFEGSEGGDRIAELDSEVAELDGGGNGSSESDDDE